MKFSIKGKNLIEHYRKSPAFTVIDLLLVALLIFAITVAVPYLVPEEEAATAYVYVDGKLNGNYALNADREIIILDGKITLKIREGAIAVKDSNCPTHICQKTGYISKAGERIVCAPNKVVIVLRTKEEDKIYITGGVS